MTSLPHSLPFHLQDLHPFFFTEEKRVSLVLREGTEESSWNVRRRALEVWQTRRPRMEACGVRGLRVLPLCLRHFMNHCRGFFNPSDIPFLGEQVASNFFITNEESPSISTN
ncbi:hypothetical protein ERO13_D10G050101v2 [Gossypium hirsutum]|nr:hypothetical protein ERO13_D10G050101v2 [Gossypium hirsutum]